MPRKNWQAQTSQNSANTNTTNANNSNNKNGLVTEHFYSNVLQLLKENLAKSLISTDVNSVSNASNYLLEFGKLLENTSIHSKATSSSSNEVALNKNPCDSPGKLAFLGNGVWFDLVWFPECNFILNKLCFQLYNNAKELRMLICLTFLFQLCFWNDRNYNRSLPVCFINSLWSKWLPWSVAKSESLRRASFKPTKLFQVNDSEFT